MTLPIKILHLENDPADAELIHSYLIQKGIVCERLVVDNKPDFVAALIDFSPDIILADHSSAGFTSTEALILTRQYIFLVPFILVTGNVSEEYAAQVVKDGAYDYILKSHLQRLPSAITRALESYNHKMEKQKYLDEIIVSEANLRAVFENTPVAYVLMDRKLNIISFNDIANKYLIKDTGTPLQAGINIIDYPPEARKADTQSLFLDVLEGNPVNYERNYTNKDHKKVWYQTHVDPVIDQDNKAMGLIMTIIETTERKEAELEKEKVAADLVYRNKDLEQFAYIVSHNLRAPIANIIGVSDILQDPALDRETSKDMHASLSNSVNRLDAVIKDLNDILQVKREVCEKNEMVTFSKIVEDIKVSISNLIKSENVEIICQFDEVNEFFTLKSYLYSAFYNLISNSIKYSRPDIHPVIVIKSSLIKNKIVLTFKDNGLGIDLEKKGDQVFGLYKRFHLHKEGKGMGLYMTKTQVETMGGSITVSSTVNEGTEFRIEFEKP